MTHFHAIQLRKVVAVAGKQFRLVQDIEERGLEGKVFFSGTGLPSTAGQYIKSGAIQTIHFWDPKIAAIAMNKLAS
ncbi:MAG: hypothetical protein LUG50_09600 [Planctomycetaceae bacterium]|nr:hypothetical protein [Planctomycetaceae bacterium]